MKNLIVILPIIIILIVIYQLTLRYDYITLRFDKVQYIVKIDKLFGSKCHVSGLPSHIAKRLKLQNC